jgi:hypothetical protein
MTRPARTDVLDAVFALTAAAPRLPDPADVLDAVFADLSAWTAGAAPQPIPAGEPADWAAETLWLHPDPTAFLDRRGEVEEVLHARLAALPRGLRAGPPGCAVPRNVPDFLEDGQPDRAWRLAASLFLAARRQGLEGFEDTTAYDLAASALLLATDVHGCVVGLVELLSLLDDLADHATNGAVGPPAPGLQGPALAMRISRRRREILERVAGRVSLDGASAPERLMWRAPIARREAEGSGEG